MQLFDVRADENALAVLETRLLWFRFAAAGPEQGPAPGGGTCQRAAKLAAGAGHVVPCSQRRALLWG